MNGFPLVELLIQVTLWSLLGLGLLLIVNRYFPRHLAGSAFGLMMGIVLLTVLTCLPWPSWINAYVNTRPVESIRLTSEAVPSLTQSTDGLDLGNLWKRWQGLMQTLPQAQERVAQPATNWSWFTWLQLVVVGGVLLGLFRLLWVMHSTHRLVATAELVAEPALIQQMDDLKKSLDCQKCIRLLMSNRLNLPATVGWWKPTILLPEHWRNWNADEQRTVLAHELAHIQRADYLVMVLTQVVTIVYWFHPLVRLISKWLRRGQELSADALAARVMGDAKLYLQSLCRLALDQDDRRLPAPARLFLSPEVSLLRRIAMLRDGSRKMTVSKKSLRWVVMMGLIVTGAIVASMRSSSIADEPATNIPSTTTTTWQKYVDPNCPGYVVCHPAAAMSLASMEPHRTGLNRSFKEEIDVIPTIRGMGIPLDAVECFAGPLQVQLRKNGEKGTGTITIRGVYYQLRTKADAEAWIKHCMFYVEKVEHKLGTYYKTTDKAKDGLNPSYFLRPDERTIIFGVSEKEVLDWLAAAGKPVTSPAWLQDMPSDTGIATVAVNMKSDLIKNTVLQAGEGAAINPMFKSVYQHEGSMIGTVLKGDNLSFQLRLGCGDAEAATQKKKQLDALCALLKIVQVSGTTNTNTEKEAADHQLVVDLMNNLKSHQDGNMLQFNTHCALTLGNAIAGQIVELKGGIEKKK
ncbi:MAG TPA: M56 family metallopeptidase [Gemmatales bacterium]|nr:M56 family metallopeptidase [Gemmatales bacterium]